MAPLSLKLADLRSKPATEALADQLKPADKNRDGKVDFKELASLGKDLRAAAADQFAVTPEISPTEPPGPLEYARTHPLR